MLTLSECEVRTCSGFIQEAEPFSASGLDRNERDAASQGEMQM